MSGTHIADRLRARLNRDEGLKALDRVVEGNAYVDGQPWSFEGHEYQREILRDTHQRIGVRKCSQVGLSELMVQKTLALTSVIPNRRIIFSLPTKEMALSFSKDRFDGAIEASDYYSSMVKAGGDSASQKRIGSTTLYVVGTYGAKAGISVPAEFVISDEVDFSNEVVLGKMNSRLRHAHAVDEFGNRGYRYRFSTPTVDGFGVDIDFQAGDQRYYMCRCEHCGHIGTPDYFKDLIIPGYNGKIDEFTRADLADERYRPDDAWMKCGKCGKDLWASLCDPSRRMWVAKNQEVRKARSYQVFPWDVPGYNTPKEILSQLRDYPLKSDFINFVIGLPYSDAENSFFTDELHRQRQGTVVQWIAGQIFADAPTFGGMDVGKTCHFNVRVPVGKHSHIVYTEKIKNTREAPAYARVLELYDAFDMVRLCIDNGPDITLVRLLVGAREGISTVVYVKNIQGTLPVVEVKDGEQVNADRTKTLTLLLNDHNSGDVFYPVKDDVSREIYAHLKTTKKIREKNSDGEMVERFSKSSDMDHWVHSLNYSNIALLIDGATGRPVQAAAPATVGRVKVGSAAVGKETGDKPKLSGLFGLGGAVPPSMRRR